MLSPLLRHLLSEEQGRTEWTGTGDRAWTVHRQRRGGGGGGGGGGGSGGGGSGGGFERYATAVIDMRDYDQRDINVSVEDGKVIVHGCRREGDDSSFEAHETRRSLELPADADASQLRYAKARGVVNLEVPLVKVPRSGGRRHRPEEQRLTIEQRRRTFDDAGTPALGGGASTSDDVPPFAEAMGLWRRRDEASAAPYALRVPAPGFSASNVEVILVEGKAIVKALIKDNNGMRSMRHSFIVPALIDAGRMTAEFVAAPTGDGGELLLTAPEVSSSVSGGGGLAEGEAAAATQQLSPEFALGGGSGVPDVSVAAGDRSAQQPLIEAQSLAGTLFPQPPAEGPVTPTADAASVRREAAAAPAEAEAAMAPSSSAGDEAKGGAWPLTKSPFELGLEPPPYADESAGDARWRRLSAAASSEEESSQVAQQPPLHELMERSYGFERSVASAPSPTGADEPPAVSERAPEALSKAAEADAWPPASGTAGGGGAVAGGGPWPPAKSPFELGLEQSQYAAAAEENAGGAGAGDERWWPLPPRGEAAASTTTSKGSGEVSLQWPPPSPPPSPLHEVIAPRYGSERPVMPAPSTGADKPPTGIEREAPGAQTSAAIGEPASGAAAGGDVGAGEAWPPTKLPLEEQPLHTVTLSKSAGGAALDVDHLASLSSGEAAAAPEATPREAAAIEDSGAQQQQEQQPPLQEPFEPLYSYGYGYSYVSSPSLPPTTDNYSISTTTTVEAGDGLVAQPNSVGEAERREVGLERQEEVGLDEEVERRPEAQEEVMRRTEAEKVTSIGDADVRVKPTPVVAGVQPEQLFIIGGEEQQHEAARPEIHEEAQSRPEAEEVSVGGAADTGADDSGAVYVPGAYTIRSGHRGYAAQTMPTPEKAAAVTSERRYGQPIGGDGGRAHRTSAASETAPEHDVAEGAPTFPPTEKARSTTGEEPVPRDVPTFPPTEKARSTMGEEPVPRDAGHAKTFDVAATQQEMRHAHELGGA